jgi:putative ABC transport system permease protein
MIAYWRRALAAQLRGARTLFALTVFGVALGIASVLAIQVINRSAIAAFEGSVAALSGDADLSVVPRAAALPESLLVLVRGDPAVRQLWPLYEITAAVDGRDQFYLTVVGVDLFAPLRLPWREDGAAVRPADALGTPGWAAITPSLAAELGLAAGDTLAVSSGTRRAVLRVGALVDFRRYSPLASRKLVVMDIAQAQHLLGGDARGALTQINVVLDSGARAADARPRLAARVGAAAEVLAPEQRQARAEGLLAAFRLNLTALSLISLVVGFFLVHTSTQAALVRRRVEFGVLRSAGATRGQLLALILADVLLLGLAGVAIGVPLGLWVARANVDLVSATISNLYLLNEIERLDVPPVLVAGAAALGLLAALAGALGPALDASRRDVRALLAAITLHEQAGARALPLLLIAGALLAAALAWYATLGRAVRPAGFVLGVALLGAVPLAVPWLVQRIALTLDVRRFGLAFAMKSLAVRLQTTAFAVTSLALAVAMMVGVTVMIGSFRQTVALWLDASLRADVYVSTPSWRGTGAGGTMDSAVVRALESLPGVAAADRFRGFTALSAGRRIAVGGVDMALPGGDTRFPMYRGDAALAVAAARRGAVIISEPLHRKSGLGLGDSLPLATPRGERRFPIAGISYDYATEGGAAALDLATLADAFGPGPINSMALYLAPGGDPERTIDRIRALLPGIPLNLRSNRSLKTEALRVFDQTFAVTRLLQVMALLVAVTGITLTLLILARERAQEMAVYRATGATRRQVFRVFVGKGFGLAALGLATGCVTGGALAAVLIYAINRDYFGWTIQVHVPWATLGRAAAAILAAALAASAYPALRAGATPVTDLSRDDL